MHHPSSINSYKQEYTSPHRQRKREEAPYLHVEASSGTKNLHFATLAIKCKFRHSECIYLLYFFVVASLKAAETHAQHAYIYTCTMPQIFLSVKLNNVLPGTTYSHNKEAYTIYHQTLTHHQVTLQSESTHPAPPFPQAVRYISRQIKCRSSIICPALCKTAGP